MESNGLAKIIKIVFPDKPETEPKESNPIYYRVRFNLTFQDKHYTGEDINVLAIVKGGEKYVFLYDDKNKGEALRVLGRFASNPELSFTWYYAAVCSQRIRREHYKQTLIRRGLEIVD